MKQIRWRGLWSGIKPKLYKTDKFVGGIGNVHPNIGREATKYTLVYGELPGNNTLV